MLEKYIGLYYWFVILYSYQYVLTCISFYFDFSVEFNVVKANSEASLTAAAFLHVTCF